MEADAAILRVRQEHGNFRHALNYLQIKQTSFFYFDLIFTFAILLISHQKLPEGARGASDSIQMGLDPPYFFNQ
jgi:hypothetical protein